MIPLRYRTGTYPETSPPECCEGGDFLRFMLFFNIFQIQKIRPKSDLKCRSLLVHMKSGIGLNGTKHDLKFR